MSGLPPNETRFLLSRFVNNLRNWVLPKQASFPTEQKTIIYYTQGVQDTHLGRTMDVAHESILFQIIRDNLALYRRDEHLVVFSGQENGITMSLQHEFDLVRTATTVIGPHGSALANILWLPGADSCEHRPKVVEFLVQPSQTVLQVRGSLYLFGYPQWVEYHHLYYTSNSAPDSMFLDLLDLFPDALNDVFQNRASDDAMGTTNASWLLALLLIDDGNGATSS